MELSRSPRLMVPEIGQPTDGIGAAAATVGVSPATLRVWERQGLISPHRTASGYRLYVQEDIERLLQIKNLHTKGLNVAGIKEVLGYARPRISVPDAGPNGPGLKLGQHLRRLRKQRRLTLLQAASEIGISISFLSDLERNQTGVSMRVLRRTLDFYGTTLQRLSSPRSSRNRQHRLTRPGRRPVLRHSIEGVKIEELATGPHSMTVEIFEVQPGASSQGSYSHGGEEFVYMIEGSLHVRLGESENYELKAGDCLYFLSSLEHDWVNRGTEPARLLWVNGLSAPDL